MFYSYNNLTFKYLLLLFNTTVNCVFLLMLQGTTFFIIDDGNREY